MIKKPTIEIYDARDGWRWRLRASNGRIIADGAEAYVRRADCLTGVLRTRAALIDLDRWLSGAMQRGKKR